MQYLPELLTDPSVVFLLLCIFAIVLFLCVGFIDEVVLMPSAKDFNGKTFPVPQWAPWYAAPLALITWPFRSAWRGWLWAWKNVRDFFGEQSLVDQCVFENERLNRDIKRATNVILNLHDELNAKNKVEDLRPYLDDVKRRHGEQLQKNVVLTKQVAALTRKVAKLEKMKKPKATKRKAKRGAK